MGCSHRLEGGLEARLLHPQQADQYQRSGTQPALPVTCSRCRLATAKPREKVLPLSTSNLRLRPTEGSLLSSRLSICYLLIAFCKRLHIPHVRKPAQAYPLSPALPPSTTCLVQVPQPVRFSKTTLGTILVATKPALGMQVNSALQNHPRFSGKKGTKIARKKMQKIWSDFFLFYLIHSR